MVRQNLNQMKKVKVIHIPGEKITKSKSDPKHRKAHLYFISNERISYNPNGGTNGLFLCLHELDHPEDAIVKNVGNCTGCRKIVAFTDSSLNLPLIPESFVKEFVESNGSINEVEIEIIERLEEEWFEDDYTGEPGFISYNEVIIYKEEKTFTLTGNRVAGSNTDFDISIIDNNVWETIQELNLIRQEFNKMIDERIKQLQNQ